MDIKLLLSGSGDEQSVAEARPQQLPAATVVESASSSSSQPKQIRFDVLTAAARRRSRSDWSEQEERLFLKGLLTYGLNYKKIAANLLPRRNTHQVKSHSKYIMKAWRRNSYSDSLPYPSAVSHSSEQVSLSASPEFNTSSKDVKYSEIIRRLRLLIFELEQRSKECTIQVKVEQEKAKPSRAVPSSGTVSSAPSFHTSWTPGICTENGHANAPIPVRSQPPSLFPVFAENGGCKLQLLNERTNMTNGP